MDTSYRILNASYKTSVHQSSQLEVPSLPEVAFVGRSNVGKSSLINVLVNQNRLAQTSKSPGRTRAINFFDMSFRSEQTVDGELVKGQPTSAYLVDLPGYGYAAVAKGVKKQWKSLLADYISERSSLAAVALLLDCRREPSEEEFWFLEACPPELMVLTVTKVDKLGTNERNKRVAAIAKTLEVSVEKIIPTSSAKSRTGIDKLRNVLCERVVAYSAE